MHMGYHRNTLFCSTAITTNKFRSILSGVTLNLPAGLHGKKKQYSEEEVQDIINEVDMDGSGKGYITYIVTS